MKETRVSDLGVELREHRFKRPIAICCCLTLYCEPTPESFCSGMFLYLFEESNYKLLLSCSGIFGSLIDWSERWGQKQKHTHTPLQFGYIWILDWVDFAGPVLQTETWDQQKDGYAQSMAWGGNSSWHSSVSNPPKPSSSIFQLPTTSKYVYRDLAEHHMRTTWMSITTPVPVTSGAISVGVWGGSRATRGKGGCSDLGKCW